MIVSGDGGVVDKQHDLTAWIFLERRGDEATSHDARFLHIGRNEYGEQGRFVFAVDLAQIRLGSWNVRSMTSELTEPPEMIHARPVDEGHHDETEQALGEGGASRIHCDPSREAVQDVGNAEQCSCQRDDESGNGDGEASLASDERLMTGSSVAFCEAEGRHERATTLRTQCQVL